LKIWQHNLNTSLAAQESLLNRQMITDYNIVAIQEPHVNFLRNTQANHRWHVLYLSHHHSHPQTRACAVILINTSLNTNS
ncbi:hypothetical protein BDR06DRAFT_878193, partial [Suillus hirtellus]